ncbi:hypothetical protein J6X15_01800 [Candidatus Saccharibacteria bacterium]|nr:hypothetical protein [Candidatus Saccharibacteria bacterium]
MKKNSKMFGRIFCWFSALVMLFPSNMVAATSQKDFIDKYSHNNIKFYNPDECSRTSGSSSPSSIGGKAVVSGKTAKEKIWSGLKSMGVTDEVAAGIMGNMQGESGFSPARYEEKHRDVWETFDWENDPAKGHGVGLIQWSGGRRPNLFKYTRGINSYLVDEYLKKPTTYGGLQGDDFIKAAKNESEADALYSIELTFLIEEMKGESSYAQVFNETTVAGAAVSFSVNVEGCSTCTANSENTAARRSNAEAIFREFSGKTSFGSGSAANPGGGAQAAASDGSDVTWIGDSITDMAKDEILKKMPKADVRAQVSKSWSHVYTSGNTSGLDILKDLVSKKQLRDNLVFALGTNDDDISEASVKKIIEIAPDVKRVVLVTNYKINDEHEYDKNNKAIKAGPTIDSRFVVADWAEAVSSSPSKYIIADSDSVHPTKEGIPLFVETILKALGSTGGNTISQSGSCECGNSNISTNGIWAGQKYDLTDRQLAGIMAMIKGENGETLEMVQSEATIMANLYEYERPKSPRTGDGLVAYLRTSPKSGGWFATYDDYNESFKGYKPEEFDAIKDIFNNGNRTMPPEILEHDCINCKAGINYAYNDGVEFDVTDRSKYVSGKTLLKQGSGGLSGQYIFYKFADDTLKKGDPFGYFENKPPSGTSTRAASSKNSNITFDNEGWIQGGIDGYTKEPAVGKVSGLDSAANQNFPTDMPNGKGKGPNKITLHSTEGANGGGGSGLQFFMSSGVPPHFTIDMHEKKVYQHFPIYKTSAAVKSHDDTAGIQIEIIGYSDAALAQSRGQSKWILATGFEDSEIDYLAQLLIGIGAATGIPMESSANWSGGSNPVRMTDTSKFKEYKGILGHRHVPGNTHWDPDGLWDKLKAALGRNGGTAFGQCSYNATGDVAALQNLVLRWAWPEYHSKPYTTKKPEYDEDIKKSKYTGDSCYGGGVDCGGFVYSLVTLSGWDPDLPTGPTAEMLPALQKSTTWTEVTSRIHSNADAQPGDIIIKDGHVLIYVGKIPGFGGEMASASQCGRAPMADSAKDISYYANKPEYHIFRKVK